MAEDSRLGVCARLAEIRARHFGARGKSKFARQLGIGSSTYDRYERDRMPPADVLMNAAQLTNTRIEWLITGEGLSDAVSTSETGRVAELTNQLRRILHRRPDWGDQIDSFLSLLAEQVDTSPAPRVDADEDWQRFVPVVGSTAAGPAHFWEEIDASGDGEEADAHLEQLLEAYAERTVESSGAMTTPLSATPAESQSQQIALVQFSRPDELGFLEFLSGTNIKEKFPKAVAWRIDGDSMSPRYEDGDFVITSPDIPALSGHPCVARQNGQIGVNCKLLQERGTEVALIPVNDKHAVQMFPKDQIQWAYRVLYAVRLH